MAVIEDVVRPLRELLTFVFFGVLAVRLGQRIRGATPLTRRALGPVLAVACFRCAAFCSATLGRRLVPESGVVDVSMWLLAMAVPLTAVAFLAGLLRWWVFMAGSTQRLVAKLGADPTPEDVRLALAEAFDDPSLAIVYWLGDGDGHWGDADGHRLDPPSPGPGRAVTTVLDGDRLVAAIIHDSALQDERAFVDARDLVCGDDVRSPPPGGGGVVAVGRGPRLARADPDRRAGGAPAHRARPPRWRAATACRVAHQA